MSLRPSDQLHCFLGTVAVVPATSTGCRNLTPTPLPNPHRQLGWLVELGPAVASRTLLVVLLL